MNSEITQQLLSELQGMNKKLDLLISGTTKASAQTGPKGEMIVLAGFQIVSSALTGILPKFNECLEQAKNAYVDNRNIQSMVSLELLSSEKAWSVNDVPQVMKRLEEIRSAIQDLSVELSHLDAGS